MPGGKLPGIGPDVGIPMGGVPRGAGGGSCARAVGPVPKQAARNAAYFHVFAMGNLIPLFLRIPCSPSQEARPAERQFAQ